MKPWVAVIVLKENDTFDCVLGIYKGHDKADKAIKEAIEEDVESGWNYKYLKKLTVVYK